VDPNYQNKGAGTKLPGLSLGYAKEIKVGTEDYP